MVSVSQAKIDRFNAIKELMIVELADLEIEMDELQQIFNEKMAELGGRRDVLRSALYDEVTPVRVILEEDLAENLERVESDNNAERLLSAIHANPGASKADLRTLLPELTEGQLKRALDHCSKKHFIENRGTSKARPAWYAV